MWGWGEAKSDQQNESADLEERLNDQNQLLDQLKEVIRENETKLAEKERSLEETKANFSKHKLQTKAKINQLTNQLSESQRKQSRECVSPLKRDEDDDASSEGSRGSYVTEQSSRAKLILLKKQLDDSRSLNEKREKNLEELNSKIEHFDELLSEKDAEIEELKKNHSFSVQDEGNDGNVYEMYAQMVYKDNKILELDNRILQLEGSIMDVQETVKEKDQVIEARNKAIQLLTEDLSLRKKNVVDQLEDTRGEMRQMQFNFSTLETRWNEEKESLVRDFEAEKGELQSRIVEKDNKLTEVEESLKKLESVRFELSTRNAALQEKVVLLQENVEKIKRDVLNDSAKDLKLEIKAMKEQLTEKDAVIDSLHAAQKENSSKQQKNPGESKSIVKIKAQYVSRIKNLEKQLETAQNSADESQLLNQRITELETLNETLKLELENQQQHLAEKDENLLKVSDKQAKVKHLLDNFCKSHGMIEPTTEAIEEGFSKVSIAKDKLENFAENLCTRFAVPSIDALDSALDSLLAREATLLNEIESHKTEMETYKTEIESYQTQIENYQTEVIDVKKELNQAQRDLEQLETSSKEEKDALNARIRRQDEEFSNAKLENEQFLREIENVQRELAERDRKLTEFNEMMENKVAVISGDRERELMEFQNRLADAGKTERENMNKVEAMTAEMRDKEIIISNLELRLDEKEKEIDDLQQKSELFLKEKEDLIEKFRRETAESVSESEKMFVAEKLELETSLEGAEQQIDEKDAMIRQLEKEIEENDEKWRNELEIQKDKFTSYVLELENDVKSQQIVGKDAMIGQLEKEIEANDEKWRNELEIQKDKFTSYVLELENDVKSLAESQEKTSDEKQALVNELTELKIRSESRERNMTAEREEFNNTIRSLNEEKEKFVENAKRSDELIRNLRKEKDEVNDILQRLKAEKESLISIMKQGDLELEKLTREKEETKVRLEKEVEIEVLAKNDQLESLNEENLSLRSSLQEKVRIIEEMETVARDLDNELRKANENNVKIMEEMSEKCALFENQLDGYKQSTDGLEFKLRNVTTMLEESVAVVGNKEAEMEELRNEFKDEIGTMIRDKNEILAQFESETRVYEEKLKILQLELLEKSNRIEDMEKTALSGQECVETQVQTLTERVSELTNRKIELESELQNVATKNAQSDAEMEKLRNEFKDKIGQLELEIDGHIRGKNEISMQFESETRIYEEKLKNLHLELIEKSNRIEDMEKTALSGQECVETQVQTLTERVNELSALKSELESELQNVATKYAQSDAELEKLRNEFKDKIGQLELEIDGHICEKNEISIQLESKTRIYEDRLNNLQLDLEEKLTRIEDMQKSVQNSQEYVDSQVQTLTDRINELSALKTDLESELQNISPKYARSEEKIKELHTELDAVSYELQNITQKRVLGETKTADLQNELETRTSELRKLHALWEDLQSKCAISDQDQQQRAMEIQNLQAEKAVLQERLAAISVEVEENVIGRSKLESELTILAEEKKKLSEGNEIFKLNLTQHYEEQLKEEVKYRERAEEMSENLKQENEKLLDYLNRKESEIKQLQIADNDNLKQKLNQIDELSVRNLDLESSIERLKRESEELTESRKVTETTTKRAVQSDWDAEWGYDSALPTNEKLLEENVKLKSDIEDLRQKDKKEDSGGDWESRNKALVEENGQLVSEIEVLKTGRMELEDLNEKHQQMLKDFRESQTQFDVHKKDMDELRNSAKELSDERDKLAAELDALKEENETVMSDFNELNKLYQQEKDELEKFKAVANKTSVETEVLVGSSSESEELKVVKIKNSKMLVKLKQFKEKCDKQQVEIGQLFEENSSLRGIVDTLKAGEETLLGINKQLESKVEEVQQEMNILSQEQALKLRELLQEKTGLENSLSALNEEKERLQRETASSVEQAETLMSDNNTFQTVVENLKQAKTRMEEELRQYATQIYHLTEEKEKMQRQQQILNDIKVRYEDIRPRHEQTEMRCVQLEQELASVSGKYDICVTQNEELSKEKVELELKMVQMGGDEEQIELRRLMKRIESERDELQQIVSHKEDEVKRLRVEVDRVENGTAQLSRQLEQLKGDSLNANKISEENAHRNAALVAEIETISSAKSALEKEFAELQTANMNLNEFLSAVRGDERSKLDKLEMELNQTAHSLHEREYQCKHLTEEIAQVIDEKNNLQMHLSGLARNSHQQELKIEELQKQLAEESQNQSTQSSDLVLNIEENQPLIIPETNFTLTRTMRSTAWRIQNWVQGRRKYAQRLYISKSWSRIFYYIYIFILHVTLLYCAL